MDWFVQQYVIVYAFIRGIFDGFNPKEWGDWLYLIYLAAGLFWIGYQFNRLRRRGAREFDKWVQEQTTKLRENFAEERTDFIERAYVHAHSSVWWRTVVMVVARAKLILQFIARLLLLRRWTPSVSYAMTLWRAGRKEKARALLLSIAADLESKLPTYLTLEAAKRLEARNAFLYAGLAAGEISDAKSAFGSALRLSQDKDVEAHKLLARRILDVQHNSSEALPHCDKLAALGNDNHDELLIAESYRLRAEATGISTQPGRELLASSLRLDGNHNNYRGMARTQELYGDIYFPLRGAKHYRKSVKNYQLGNDWISARRVEDKLSKLVGKATPVSRILDRFAIMVQQLAMRMRARPQT